jgi:acetaldehyde dehydrogenase (acetylating)
MELYDKDLLSVQEVRGLVKKAKRAQEELAKQEQGAVDKLVASMARAGVENGERLAKMAQEETGFGVARDKTLKNYFASQGVYDYIKNMKTVGELGRDEEKKIRKLAVPVGVIGGLVPSTNPTSTVLYKALISIKAGNAIVFSPHPNAKGCILETVKILRQALAQAGGMEELISCITIPTMEATEALMKHPDISLILATGGSAMVRAAYSSGTPAIGVGPGNGPAFIEKTADLPQAVKRILDSKTFDNGTICASEQSVICTEDMTEAVQGELERQGACFLKEPERKKLGTYILRANGTMNPAIVGKSAKDIAALAGISVPENTRVLVAREDGIGRGHPFSYEKLAPILAFYTAKDYQEVCRLSRDILLHEGAGHTFSMHTRDEQIVDYFSRRIPVSRLLVNTSASIGGIGGSTNLAPALTLGCGAIGGSATSENVSPADLYNIRYVAYGTRELEEIRKVIPHQDWGESGGETQRDFGSVDQIVRKIIEKLQAM